MCISSLIHSKQAHLCQLLKKSFFFPPPTLLYPLGNISCVFSTLACHQMSSVFGWAVGVGGIFPLPTGMPFMTVHLYQQSRGRKRLLAFATLTSPSIDMPFISLRTKKQTTSAKEQLISNIPVPSSYWLVHFKALCIPNATCSSLQRAFSTLMGMMVLIALSQCEHFVFFSPPLSLILILISTNDNTRFLTLRGVQHSEDFNS